MAQRGLLGKGNQTVAIKGLVPSVDKSGASKEWSKLAQNLMGLGTQYFQKKAAQENFNAETTAGSIAGAQDEQQISTKGHSDAWVNAARSTFQAKIGAQTQDDIQTLFNEMGDNPDEFEKSARALVGGTLAGITSDAPEFAGKAKQGMDNVVGAYVRKARDNKIKKDAKAQVQLLAEGTDTAVEASKKAVVSLSRADAVETIKIQRDGIEEALIAQVEVGNIDELQSDKVLAAFDAEMAGAFVKKGLDEAIAQGEGKKFLLDFIQNNDGELREDVKKNIVRDLKTHLARINNLQDGIARENKLKEDAQRAQFTAELDVGVSRGQVTYRELDNLKADRKITDREWAAHTKKLDSLKRSQKAEIDFSEIVKNALVSGTWLPHENSKLQAAMDKYYLKNLQESGKDPLSNEGMSYAVQLSKTGIVPKSVVSMIDNISRGGNLDRAVLVSDLVSRLREDAPAAYSRLSESQKAFAMMTSRAINAGADPETTIANAREYVYQTDEGVKKILETQVNSAETQAETITQLDSLIDSKWDEWFNDEGLNSNFTDGFGLDNLFPKGLFRDQPVAPPEMVSDYNELVTQAFLHTRNLDAAYEMANDALPRFWGKTNIDGTNRLTRLPVESNYPEGAVEWLKQSLDIRKQELGDDDQDIIVITDTDTERAKARDKSYALYTVDKYGTPVPLLDGKNMPARWKPNPDETEVMKKNKILKQDALDEADQGQKVANINRANEADYNFNKKGADAKLRKIVKDVRGIK